MSSNYDDIQRHLTGIALGGWPKKHRAGFFLYSVCTITIHADAQIQVKNFQPTCRLESVKDFLIKLDMKPCMHLAEISIFSLNLVIVRLTKIMNRAYKNWAQFQEIKDLKNQNFPKTYFNKSLSPSQIFFSERFNQFLTQKNYFESMIF